MQGQLLEFDSSAIFGTKHKSGLFIGKKANKLFYHNGKRFCLRGYPVWNLASNEFINAMKINVDKAPTVEVRTFL